MVEEPEEITTLQQIDPLLKDQPHLDYQVLREEGLTHIGNLSGKIWTDHNAHDPGITILEVLCYALIDLGYRVSLPIEDLLTREAARDNDFEEDDNFYTPLQILSCNPTSISDYRRLLLEVEGVRNAWLEPAVVENPAYSDDKKAEGDDPDKPHRLNGLYSVLLEISADADKGSVLSQTQTLLSSHRNLCEDFHEVTLLCPVDIGVCADVEIEKSADASTVYEAVLKALDNYISPSITYYTLQQLLDKDMPIEDIFAGRPFLTESYGFVDLEELENLPLPSELRLSDIYKELLAIDGVVAVRQLNFDEAETGSEIIGIGNIQRLRIIKGYTGAFSTKKTCIQLTTGVGALNFDKRAIEDRLASEAKRTLDREFLDEPIPRGRYLNGLGDYVSIQHEFPLVYGVGEGGLPDNASLLRKIQALQLKGFLLFYDQLLVDYLAQLTHLRDFFSLHQESKRVPGSQHTYFTQKISGVSALPQLLQTHAAHDIVSGNALAVPVVNNAALSEKLSVLPKGGISLSLENNCGSEQGDLCLFTTDSQKLCTIYVNQAIRDIRQDDYTVVFHQDQLGYFFIIRFNQVDELVLIGTGRYASMADVHEAANFAAFMAIFQDAYRKMSRRLPSPFAEADEDTHTVSIDFHYEIIFNPLLLDNYVQHLLEDEAHYYERREVFIRHLMARFAEQFTDYTLLKFGAKKLTLDEKKQSVEDKSRFLDEYDDVSRNRGRAYDYLAPAWGTTNVSGFEKRTALLAGMRDWKRRTLCNFEVGCCYTLEVKDIDDQVLLKSLSPIDSKKGLEEEREQLIQQLQNPDDYASLESKYVGFNALHAQRLFATVAASENIKITRHVYALKLVDTWGISRHVSSKQDYVSSRSALAGEKKFINEINGRPLGMKLRSVIKGSRLYLDEGNAFFSVEKHITFRWHQFDSNGNELADSVVEFANPDTALRHFSINGNHEGYIVKDLTGYRWQIDIGNGNYLTGSPIYSTEIEAKKGWARSKNFGQDKDNYRSLSEASKKGEVKLIDDKNRILASGTTLSKMSEAEQFISSCIEYYASKKDHVEILSVSSVYKYQLCDRKGNVLLSSIYCYEDLEEAIHAFLGASEEARNKNRFRSLGSDEFPEYRIQFKSNDEAYWAISEAFDTEKERDSKLRTCIRELKAIHKKVDMLEEPPTFSWSVEAAEGNRNLLRSEASFNKKSDAEKDLADCLLRTDHQVIKSHLYKIEVDERPADYKFLYFANRFEKDAAPLLISESAYDDISKARNAYSTFVKALPDLEVIPPKSSADSLRFTDGKSVSAVPFNPDPKELESTQRLLTKLKGYMEGLYKPDKSVEDVNPNYYYQFVNTDHPAAFSLESWSSQDEAVEQKKELCKGRYYELDPKVPLIKIVCPEKSVHNFHFAICLSVDPIAEPVPIFISYTGYATREEAELEAATAAYEILNIGRKKDHIGTDNHLICLNEKYSEDTGLCEFRAPHVAVVPDSFKTYCASEQECINTISKLCNLYPIRLVNREEKARYDEETPYEFRASTFPDGEVVEHFMSPETYATPEEAEEAYHYFIALTNYKGNCRVTCFEGEYRVQVVEVLLRSAAYYSSPEEAWGDSSANQVANPCEPAGVRKLAKVFEHRDVYEAVIHATHSSQDRHQFYVFDSTDESAISRKRVGALEESRIESADSEKVLAFSPNRYASKEEVTSAINRTISLAGDDGMHVLEHILLRPSGNQRTESLLQTCKDLCCELTWQEDPVDERCAPDENESAAIDYVAGADPYSFWATLVLPGWLERFQSEERRFLFKQMLHREAPALVGLNILWLRPSQMCQFEASFKEWLSWFRTRQSCKESPTDSLIDCIEALEMDKLCIEPDPDQGECACVDDSQPEPDKCIVQADSIYWLDCIESKAMEPLYIECDTSNDLDQSEPEEIVIEQAQLAKEAEILDPEKLVPEESEKENPAVKKSRKIKELPETVLEDAQPVKEKEAKKKVTKKKPALSKKTGKGTKKTKPNLPAILALMATRKQQYLDRLSAVTVKTVTGTEAYGRAQHFVNTQPVLGEYQRIIRLVTEQDFKGARSKTNKGFVDLIKATTWYLLDNLIRENGGDIPDAVQRDLSDSFNAIKDKGVDLSALASEWNSDELAEQLQVTIHKAYVRLLNEV